jgi:hypothetical protein
MRRLVPIFLFGCLCLMPGAATAADSIHLHVVASNVVKPVYVTGLPGRPGTLIVARRDGKLLRVSGGKKHEFLDLRPLVDGEGAFTENGLFSIAFSPKYKDDRRFYVAYTSRQGPERLDEWRTKKNEDVVRTDSRRQLLNIPHKTKHHYGGQLAFGPDGYLYMSTGDGSEAHPETAQDLGSLLGKLLRIDPRRDGSKPYRIPAGNPFAATEGARPEIWALGMRNGWRFSFDRKSGALTLADVGEKAREEIDWIPRKDGTGAGANLGWPCMEGTVSRSSSPFCDALASVPPVFDYHHYPQGKFPPAEAGKPFTGTEEPSPDPPTGCSAAITGGYVVRDPQVESLYGKYVFGDFCGGGVWAAKLAKPRAAAVGLRQEKPFNVVSFGEDNCGRVYLVKSKAGTVSRFEQGSSACK